MAFGGGAALAAEGGPSFMIEEPLLTGEALFMPVSWLLGVCDQNADSCDFLICSCNPFATPQL